MVVATNGLACLPLIEFEQSLEVRPPPSTFHLMSGVKDRSCGLSGAFQESQRFFEEALYHPALCSCNNRTHAWSLAHSHWSDSFFGENRGFAVRWGTREEMSVFRNMRAGCWLDYVSAGGGRCSDDFLS